MIRRTRHIRRRVLLVLLRFPNLFVPNLAPDPLLALLSSAVCGSLSRSPRDAPDTLQYEL
jgi:hypothetical protein